MVAAFLQDLNGSVTGHGASFVVEDLPVVLLHRNSDSAQQICYQL